MAKITRRLSINRGMRNGALKRGGGEQTVPYVELENCIAKDADPAQWYNEGCLRQVLDRFLSDLSAEQRVIFVRRYFYSDELEAIALRTLLPPRNVRRPDCRDLGLYPAYSTCSQFIPPHHVPGGQLGRAAAACAGIA